MELKKKYSMLRFTFRFKFQLKECNMSIFIQVFNLSIMINKCTAKPCLLLF